MLFKKWANHIRTVYHYLLPSCCVLCSALLTQSKNICLECEQDLPILPPSCRKCARPLFAETHLEMICGICQKEPPPFDSIHALFSYELPIISLIIQLKFKNKLCHAALFSELFLARIQNWYGNKPLPNLLLPIPLHPRRLAERGFNQALEIAKPIAKTLRIPLDYRGITRTKHTAPQSSLSAILRKENINGAFTAHRDYTDLSIAVIDDVVTTGQTITEYCKVLKQQGTKQIDVWCCARR